MKVGEHTEVEGGEHLSHTHEVELTGIGGSAFLRSLSDDLLEVHEVAVSSVPLVVVGGGRSKLVGVAQLGFHELVVTATKLLLSERGDVPCIGTRSGGDAAAGVVH